MQQQVKKWGARALVLAVALWAGFISYRVVAQPDLEALGFAGEGGGPITSGGGLSKVTTNSAGLLGGSGTASNPLTVTIHTTAPVGGTGSAGSPLLIDTSSSITIASFTDSGSISLTGATTASVLSSTTADWDPAGGGNLTGVALIREAPSADVIVRGLVAGTSGQLVAILNTSTSHILTLDNEDTSDTTAANRFTLPNAGAFVIPAGGGLLLRYSATTSRWTAWSSALTAVSTGLSVSGSTITLNMAGASCSAGQALTSCNATGTCSCSTMVQVVAAGSGIAVSPSSGTTTVSTNTGSGLTYAAGALTTNNGSGLTYSSGANIVNAGSGLTFSSGALITNIGAGLTYSAGAVVTNLTGGACTGGQVVTNVSAAGATTCTTVVPNDYTGTVEEYVDEFQMEAFSSSGSFFVSSSGGTSAAAIVADSASLRQSLVGLTATTATARFGIRNQVNGFLLSTTTGSRIVDWIIDVITLDDGTDKFAVLAGMFDTMTAVDQVDGCYFLYDRSNVASAPTTGANNSSNLQRWSCVCAANSVRTQYVMDGSVVSDSSFTTVSAPVSAATWNNLSVQGNGSEMDFYVGGVKSCVITSHIPTAANRFTNYALNIIKSAGTNLREVDVDRFRERFTMTSARTP